MMSYRDPFPPIPPEQFGRASWTRRLVFFWWHGARPPAPPPGDDGPDPADGGSLPGGVDEGNGDEGGDGSGGDACFYWEYAGFDGRWIVKAYWLLLLEIRSRRATRRLA